ncbi:Crp/Fnr family transcriptional regulator [Paenibacillus lautus]|uniref:Crp/Fnr family transcriptional regulator n=1 Tax=Paenibacillus lautus TaxID=1401 RepID=UPI003D2C846B
MNPSEIKRITDILPCLSTVSHHDWHHAELVSVGPSTPHRIQEGHMLQHAMFMVKGSVRIHRISEQGREITLYRVQGGQSCVLMMASILGDCEYEATASIEVESEVLLIPVGVFKEWMDHYKPLRQFIYQQFMQRITAVTNLLEDIAFKPMNYRLAHFLYTNTNDDLTALKITHEQLAVELGTAREVISRMLKDFQNQGILSLSRGNIRLTDRLALEEIIQQYLS